MSLTSIIYNQKEVRDGLLARTIRPSVRFGPIRAASLTTHYGLVGTAFDYLLRFHLQRINPFAQTRMWVAERGTELIGASEYVYQMDKNVLKSKADRQRLKADKYIAEAKAEHRRYLEAGVVADSLLVAALRLAILDVAYRAGPDNVDWSGLKAPDPLDVSDLRALLALADDATFKASRVCLLNPDFGSATELVGGADADLLVDDALIDIKTTKAPQLDPRDFCQLIGYYLLYGFDGIHGARGKSGEHQVNFLGFYFSRYGYLWKTPVSDVFPQDSVGNTAKWFYGSVCKSASKRRKYANAFRGPLGKYLRTTTRQSARSPKQRPAKKPRQVVKYKRRSRAR